MNSVAAVRPVSALPTTAPLAASWVICSTRLSKAAVSKGSGPARKKPSSSRHPSTAEAESESHSLSTAKTMPVMIALRRTRMPMNAAPEASRLDHPFPLSHLTTG